MDQSIPERPSPSSHNVDMCPFHIILSFTINMILSHTFAHEIYCKHLIQTLFLYSTGPFMFPLCSFSILCVCVCVRVCERDTNVFCVLLIVLPLAGYST